jgi:hypothetical protein
VNLEGLTEKHRGKKSLWYENSDGEVILKRCSICGGIKALSDYAKNKNCLGGVEAKCKSCDAERNRNRYKDSPEKSIARSRKWQKENTDRVFETNKKYREENKGRIAEYNRKYRIDNKEFKAEIARKYYDKNRERIIENYRKWKSDNPKRVILKRQRRRARQKALLDDFTAIQMKSTFDDFNGCALTGESGEIHWDHVIPISIGHGGTTYGNMVPLRPDLNLSKQNANIFEWFEANRQRFNLEQERFDRLIEWLGKANGMTVEEYRAYVYECHANPNEIDDAMAN